MIEQAKIDRLLRLMKMLKQIMFKFGLMNQNQHRISCLKFPVSGKWNF